MPDTELLSSSKSQWAHSWLWKDSDVLSASFFIVILLVPRRVNVFHFLSGKFIFPTTREDTFNSHVQMEQITFHL